MRKLKEIFRLRWEQGKSPELIALSIGCGRTTVREYMARAKRAGLTSWAEVENLSEDELEKKLFSRTLSQLGMRGSTTTHPIPDWVKIHQELSRPGVTIQLLWQEYLEEHPDGLKYSRFTELYGFWKKKLSLVMRRNHRAGEKAFVDYCDGLCLVDPQTGELQKTQLFVGALGLSSYTFAEATLSQSLPHWLMSHVKMYEFFQGVPETHRSRQFKKRREGGLLLRPGSKSKLQGLGQSLQNCRFTRTCKKATRQGQGGGRRLGCSALDPSRAPQPNVHFAPRYECSNPRTVRMAQWPDDAAFGQIPPRALGEHGPSCT